MSAGHTESPRTQHPVLSIHCPHSSPYTLWSQCTHGTSSFYFAPSPVHNPARPSAAWLLIHLDQLWPARNIHCYWPGSTHMCWLCAEGLIRELDISAQRSRVGTELLLAWEAPSASHGLWRRPRANCVVHLWFPVWLPGHPAQLRVRLQMDNGTAILPDNWTPALLIINHYLGEPLFFLSCHQEGPLIINKCSLRKRAELKTPEKESEQLHFPSFPEHRD